MNKSVPTKDTRLYVHVKHLTTSLVMTENLVKKFIHVTSRTMVDVLINVTKMEVVSNVFVVKDVS